MCLAVPGRVIDILDAHDTLRMARVSFDGVIREVCLACLPDAQVGDWVIAHAGMAISTVDADEAARVLGWLAVLPAAP
jgi:hydrogenase expression/formation protein HypC